MVLLFPMVVNDSRYTIQGLIVDWGRQSAEYWNHWGHASAQCRCAAPGFGNYLMGRKNLVYKAKFTTGRQMVRSDALLEFPVISGDQKCPGEYEYYWATSKCTVKHHCSDKKLQSKGYAGAKVYAFEGHQLLSPPMQKRLKTLYPDLQKYISLEK